jgi:flagellar hook assembly protein FlgD
MPISALGNTAGGATATNAADSQKSFRDADFMKIMLSEITQQDPFKPQETSKIVENMQKLQELANVKYEKFRDDQKWARDIVGQSVSVQQAVMTDAELKEYTDKGLTPDRGFQSVSGEVESYRVVGESVWIQVGGKHYQIDNVKQIDPPQKDSTYLASLADGLLGRKVQYATEEGTRDEGVVTQVTLREQGAITLTVGGKEVPMNRVVRIGVATP